VVVSQELECGGDKKGVNNDKTMILEETQDITDNTQSESVDKIVGFLLEIRKLQV
jgi:hypothetical protein